MNGFRAAGVISALLCIPAPICAHTRWQIDSARSSVQFKIPFMVVSTVRGTFGYIGGTITTDEQRPDDVRIDATIDAASLDTHDPDRDADLRGPACLDVTRFPYVTFRSVAARRISPGHMVVAGDLTIRDVTRRVDLVVEGPDTAPGNWAGERRIAAHAIATVSWKDYGLRFNRFVGDKLLLTMSVELTRS
jgi:polyisoprenoid-binding protein YceI